MDNNELNKFLGSKDLTISETMKLIDDNSSGILFVVNNDNSLIGCVTDGDIRRYLLSGGKVSDLVINATNKSPKTANSEEEALKLFHKKDYVIIPIIDENRRIIGLYSGFDKTVRKKSSLGVPIVINAGGKGSRLDPYTRVLPKPLIPVGEIPIIEHIMKEYQSYNCNEFHIIVNYKRELMKAYFADNENHYNITWYDEITPLGTGGGLTLLKGTLESTFFFVNCDTLLTANLESIIKFHKENGNAITMVCAYKNLNIPYGVVEMGLNGSLESIKEKPLLSFLTNTGVYVVEPYVIEDMQKEFIDFPDVIENQRHKGRKVAVFPVSENEWMDMGQLPELDKMRIKLYGE